MDARDGCDDLVAGMSDGFSARDFPKLREFLLVLGWRLRGSAVFPVSRFALSMSATFGGIFRNQVFAGH